MLSVRSYFLLASLALTTLVQADLLLDGGEDGWDTNRWWVQVDGVMGGRSSGFLEYEDMDTVMTFSGEINLNGGGFSSVRKQMGESVDLSSYEGVVVELDAHGYNGQAPLGMHLQLHDQPSRWGFASAFSVPLAATEDQTTSVFLPLETFDRASRSGWRCRDAGTCVLDTTRINEMDLYVLFQEGPFNVRVKSITAVTNATSFPSPVISLTTPNQIKNLIRKTISSGGKLYDYGYRELCIATYRSTLNTLLASSGGAVRDDMQVMICDGLARAAEKNNKVDVAWALRNTLDALVESLDSDGDELVISMTRAGEEELCIAVTSFPPVITVDANGTMIASGTSSGPRQTIMGLGVVASAGRSNAGVGGALLHLILVVTVGWLASALHY